MEWVNLVDRSKRKENYMETFKVPEQQWRPADGQGPALHRRLSCWSISEQTSALVLGQCLIIKLDTRQETHCACRCQSMFNKLVLLLTLEVFYTLPIVT